MKALTGILLALVLVSNVAQAAPGTRIKLKGGSGDYFDGGRLASDIRNLHPTDRPVPLPWGQESQFPWDAIQGTWAVQDHQDFATIYTVKVLKDNATKQRAVFIRQFDPDTCQLMASGQGGVQQDHAAYITMNDGTRSPYYSLSIRAFSEAAMEGQGPVNQFLDGKDADGQVYIFSILPYQNARMAFNLAADRISRKTDLNCQ